MVIDADGNYFGADQTSQSVSNEEDHRLHMQLRALADVIITDATTARREKCRPSKWAPIEIWSRTGDFEGLQATAVEGKKPFSLVRVADPLFELAKHKGQAVLLESGRTLSSILGNEIDQLVLTVTGNTPNQDVAKNFALGILGESANNTHEFAWVHGQTNAYLVASRRGGQTAE